MNNIINRIKGYYFITDEFLSKSGNISDVKNAILCGVKIIQYRNKTNNWKKIYGEAIKIKNICKNKAIFIINDRVDIALAIGADGVHLGQEDIPCIVARKLLGKNKIIGVSVNNLNQALQAQKDSANYIGVGPIFKTLTKKDASKPSGISLIKKIKFAIKKQVKIPIVAIGGINLKNANKVINAGADAICAISSVIAKDNVKEEINKFQEVFK